MCARLAGGTTLWPIASLPQTQTKSPFDLNVWNFNLRDYPDRTFVDDLLNGIDNGLNIGFIGDRNFRVSNNHFSAISNATAVAKELERELSLNRILGPFLSPPFTNFIGSPMGAIPKKRSEPVRWRIIHDLSWPPGNSINDSIPKELYKCRYDTLDNAIKQLKTLGAGALMSKLDLSDAFRHILVNKNDWELLGSTWPIEVNGTVSTGYFINAYLPFGLRSSPSLFLKYADSLVYVMEQRGVVPVWHYLDDFWSCGPPAPHNQCKTNLDLMLSTCMDLGFKANPKKTTEPCTQLELLGIELDSVSQEARITESRLQKTTDLLMEWQSRKSCAKRQLQSLIGKLNFICSVCRPGRTFLRRMLDLLKKARHPTHHLRLHSGFFKDLRWWIYFLSDWNGRTFFYDEQWITNSCLHLYTDACTTSFGALFEEYWLYETFAMVGVANRRSIAFKELYAITMAITVWAELLQSRNIVFHCDNQAVVHIINSGSSRCPHIMTLMRYLFYVCARFNIVINQYIFLVYTMRQLTLYLVYRSQGSESWFHTHELSRLKQNNWTWTPSSKSGLLFSKRTSRQHSPHVFFSTKTIFTIL